MNFDMNVVNKYMSIPRVAPQHISLVRRKCMRVQADPKSPKYIFTFENLEL